jgi:hypothetical protein
LVSFLRTCAFKRSNSCCNSAWLWMLPNASMPLKKWHEFYCHVSFFFCFLTISSSTSSWVSLRVSKRRLWKSAFVDRVSKESP